jgi:Variant SH3 domain
MNGDNGEMAKVRAVEAHEIPGRPPIQVAIGQRVQVGGQDTTWPAFVFVTTDDGSGWVPARHIDAGSVPAVMLAAYDTTELATAVGELLTALVIDDASGWTWVQNAMGREGWVPSNTIEPIPVS